MKTTIPLSAHALETVLLVEDEPALRELTTCILEKQGFRVVSAGNGCDAVHLIKTQSGPFDLVLTDLMMPGMGGKEMAALLHQSCPGLKILFTSGDTDQPAFATETVCASFIPKPFTSATLVRKIREMIDGSLFPIAETV